MPDAPVPVARYALVALLGVLGLLFVTLLVRPFIFSFSSARDDANYPLVAVSEVDAGPRIIEIVLNEPHGLPGERVQDGRAGLLVAAASLPGADSYSVVTAWSPTHDCALTLGADRLVDCDGDAWTYQGFPIDPADPALRAFPSDVRQGALVVDFTAAAAP
jgi:hypothetical protein